MSEFTDPIHYNERGARVKDAQYTLNRHNRFNKDFLTSSVDGIWGKQAMAGADEARYELGYPLSVCRIGVFGQQLYDYLRADGKHKKLPALYLARRQKRLGTTLFVALLPGRVHFPNQSYPPATPDSPPTFGLQPWIWPQVQMICKRFNLRVTDGWGGHPPHASYSDHRWGGGVDLAGSYADMVRCTFWADSLASGFYRKGKVFRWVGGPAHDANGVEPGHYNHVHLSWYRLGPATTISGKAGF